jgi:hypothetical protein
VRHILLRFEVFACTRPTFVSLLTFFLAFLRSVFAVLGGWGIGIYTAMKVFGGKKKEG